MTLLENLFSPGTIERLGWMLVHFLWQATAVALLLAVLLRLLRGAGANLRYAVACGALALMVVLPLITMQLVEIPGPVAEAGPLPEISPPETAAPTPAMVQIIEESPALAPPLETADVTVPVFWEEEVIEALESALPYIVFGWLAGVFGLSAWHLGGWAQLHRLKRRMTCKAGPPLLATLEELTGRLGVRQAVNLLESALVEVPTVVGWLRPAILLPASALTGLSPDQLRAILAHELAHIRRYDYLANILQTVVEILGFYHPAVWWVSNRIRVERENCCDDLAVHICGNSLQYARALTSLEEIRHSRTDLAMAASGGSLMARIARLLGRPAVDDRRFVWLPGLIALLLVIAIVIPTALALTRSPALTPDSPVDAIQDAAGAETSSQTQIAVCLVLADLYCDAVLDAQTAAQAADLLVRLPVDSGNGRFVEVSVPPTVEELQRPLVDVLSAFTPAPGRGNEFVNLLGPKGYAAGKLSSPKVTVRSGEPLSFTVGDLPSLDRPLPQDSGVIFVRCGVTATEIPDQNMIQMSVDLVRMYAAYKPGDPNGEIATWTQNAIVLAPNNQWMPITGNGLKRIDGSGRECLQLPLILATIVDEPESAAIGHDPAGATDPRPAPGEIIDLGPGMGGMPLMAPTIPILSPGSDASGSESARPQVLLAFTILDVAAERVLDPDTAVRVRELLTQIRPADANWPLLSTKPPALEELQAPLRDVFTRFEPIHLRGKELTDLLVSRGYAQVTSRPSLLTRTNEPATIVIGEVKDPNSPDLQPAGEYMRLTATPHVPQDQNMTRLEIDYQDQRAIGNPDDPNRKMVATQTATTLAMLNDTPIAIVVRRPSDPRSDVRLLLVGPIEVIKPAAFALDTSILSQGQAARTRIQTEWSAPQEGVQMRLRASRRLWRADEIPALHWDVRNVGQRQFLYVPDGQRSAQLEVDGVWHEYPGFLQSARLADLRVGQSLEDQLVTISPIWSQAKPEDLEWKWERSGVVDPMELRTSLHLPPGKHTIRVAVLVEPSRANTGDGFRVVSPPMEITVTPLKAGEVALWPPAPRLAQAAKETIFRATMAVQESLRPGQQMKEWIAQALTAAEQTATLADNTPLYGSAREMAETLAAMQKAVNENSAEAGDQFAAAGRAYSRLTSVLAGEIPPVAQPATQQTRVERNPGEPAVQMTTQSPPGDARDPDKAQVLVDFALAKALTAATLDRETMLLIGGTLAAEKPRAAGEIAAIAPSRKTTLGDILTKYVTRQSLSQETGQALLDLLQKRGFVKVLTRPKVITTDGDKASVRIGEERPVLPPSQSNEPVDESTIKRIEYGTFIDVTPHAGQDEHITLDLAVEVTDPVPQEQPSNLPVVRRMAIASTVIVADSRSFWLLVEPGGEESVRDRDPESMLVVFRPTALKPASGPTDPSAGQTPRGSSRPHQVLLDTRVVVMEPGNLRDVGVEWSHPTVRGGQSYDDGKWLSSVQIGYSADVTFTNALIARLAQLEAANQAQILSNPQIVTLHGCPAQLRSIREEWFAFSDPQVGSEQTRSELQKIESGTILNVTPYVGDNNEITLEMGFQLSDSLPRGQPTDLPVVTRRQARNAVTIRNGGTVAVAGLRESLPGQSSQSAKEIAIFVTATLVSETGPIPPDTRLVPRISPADKDVEPSNVAGPATRIPSQPTLDARRAFVDSDPTVRELSESIAVVERELIVSQQTLMAAHPTVERKKALLAAFQKRLQERRTELEQAFDNGRSKRPNGQKAEL